jgi:hypothetical protein
MTKIVAVKSFNGEEVEALTKDQCHFFDYESLDKEDLTKIECEYEKLADALRELIVWFCRGNVHAEDYGEGVLRKVIAMCWVVRPEVFDGMSLNKLCKAKGIKMHKQSVSKQAKNFTTKFGITGRGQKL